MLLQKWCGIYFETIFAEKLLLNFTNNYKETVSFVCKNRKTDKFTYIILLLYYYILYFKHVIYILYMLYISIIYNKMYRLIIIIHYLIVWLLLLLLLYLFINICSHSLLQKWYRIYFETIFTDELLLNFTNNYKEMASNTELNVKYWMILK